LFLNFTRKTTVANLNLGPGVMRVPEAVKPYVERLIANGNARPATDAEIAAAYPSETPTQQPPPPVEPPPPPPTGDGNGGGQSLVPSTNFDGGYF
jgi:hypothetical protein